MHKHTCITALLGALLAGVPPVTAQAEIQTAESVLGEPVADALRETGRDGVLTLEEAKRVALADNPGIAAAKARVDAAATVIQEASAAYYPTVALEASALHTEEAPVDLVGPNTSNQLYAVSGKASWLLFDGFARRFRVLAAKYGRAVAESAFRDVQRNLLEGVALAYYEALLARENMTIAEQDMAFNQTLSEETQKRFDAGAAARSDVLNFRIRKAQAESRYLSAEHDLFTARVVLAELLGIQAAQLPEDVAPRSLETDIPEDLPDIEHEAQYALQNRPDYLQIEHTVSQLHAQHRVTTADYLPVVGIEAEKGWARRDNLRFNESRDSTASVGIGLSWDIFTGGQRKARQAAVKARIREAQMNLTALRHAIVSELRRRIDATRLARKQVDLQQDITNMTSEARDLVRSEYLAGRKTLTRLNEAQTDLVRAQGELAVATIRYWQVNEQVAAASGRILRDSH